MRLPVRIGLQGRPLRQAVKGGLLSSRSEAGIPLGSGCLGRRIFATGDAPVLALAPPRTGRTATIVIPAIIGLDTDSLVIHDDQDLWRMTSGYRATLGDVRVLDLDGSTGSTGSLNPLAPSWMPPAGALRTSYVHFIASAIAPDQPGTAELVAGSILNAAEPGAGTTFTEVSDRILREGRVGALLAVRAIAPLTDPAAVACMTYDDMSPADLRGEPLHDGTMQPTTTYIVCGASGCTRQGVAAAVLQHAIWWWTLRFRPGDLLPDGRANGSFRTTMILKEVHRLAPMPEFATALERGASFGVGHLVTAPDIDTITRALGGRDFEPLFPVTIVPAQRHSATVAWLGRRLPGSAGTDPFGGSGGRSLLVVAGGARPISVRPPIFHEQPDMLVKVHNPRNGLGPPPVSTMRP